VLVRVVVSVVALLAAAPAWADAIKVLPKGGEVWVGVGYDLHKVVAPTKVSAGTQVMVSLDGSAEIAYSDNCVVAARPADVTIVESRSPCSHYAEPSYFGFSQSSQEGLRLDDAAFDFTPKVDVPEPDETAPRAPRPRNGRTARETHPWDHDDWMVAGGIAIGAGILAAILATR
jgi:hypothetical protein